MDLKIYHDRIINTVNSIISNERDRASDAGEDREAIGNLIEQIGVNKKAMSFVKALHKLEPEKREDTLRSFDALRAEFEKNWGGQKTADMFEKEPEPVTPAPLGKPSYDPDADFDEVGIGAAPTEADEVIGFADDEIAQEAADFEDNLAEVAAQ
jgi:hypothetical protein